MKIGLICCFYGNRKYLDDVISPWIELKNQNKIDLTLTLVHGQFKEYHDLGYPDNDKETLAWIDENKSKFDYIYIQEQHLIGSKYFQGDTSQYQDESTIRNYGLKYLLKNKVDAILLLDGDEIYSKSEILKLINFIDNEPYIPWFRIEFKNLVFTEHTYINGFKPPRIFRTNINEWYLRQFYYDNDVLYSTKLEEKTIDYKNLACITIPKNICNPLHFTWLDDKISKKKIEYQEKHFAHGAGCSFKWDNGLKWNEEYFKKLGQPIPELLIV